MSYDSTWMSPVIFSLFLKNAYRFLFLTKWYFSSNQGISKQFSNFTISDFDQSLVCFLFSVLDRFLQSILNYSVFAQIKRPMSVTHWVKQVSEIKSSIWFSGNRLFYSITVLSMVIACALDYFLKQINETSYHVQELWFAVQSNCKCVGHSNSQSVSFKEIWNQGISGETQDGRDTGNRFQLWSEYEF